MLSMAQPPVEARLKAILFSAEGQRPSRPILLLASLGTIAAPSRLPPCQVQQDRRLLPSTAHPVYPMAPHKTPRQFLLSLRSRGQRRSPTSNLRRTDRRRENACKIQQPQKADDIATLRKKLDVLELLLCRTCRRTPDYG